MIKLNDSFHSPHSIKINDLEKKLQVNFEKGLSTFEAQERQSVFGKNLIQQDNRKKPWLIFLGQFKNPIVYLLAFAVTVSLLMNKWLDGIAISIVIFINAFIGFYMEYRADRSMEMLKKLSGFSARVYRNGNLMLLDVEEIVPGDIVNMEAGDLVPTDLRIIKSSQLFSDESSLTGESTPVEKISGLLPDKTDLAERSNMLFKGTHITKGTATAVAVATGMNTELGKIATLVQEAEQSASPLEKKLESFSINLIKITIVLVIILFIVGLGYGHPWLEMLETSIALAVSAIPEGLPIVATLALAQGMLKMAKHKVIVKKLSSVETLGSTNVICTDKTGTLTMNKIELSTLFTASGKVERKDFGKSKMDAAQEHMTKIAALCNNAEVDDAGKEIGDPLETGLLKFLLQNDISVADLRKQFPKENEEPFSSETKMMATQCSSQDGFTVYAKGATEEIVKCCSLFFDGEKEVAFDKSKKETWLSNADEMAASGLRVIAGAYKNTKDKEEEFLSNLVFVGLFCMMDPPAENVFEAIQDCKSAGIDIIMMTGDHPATAKNIALQLGIIEDKDHKVVVGSELEEQEDKGQWVDTKVFARVSPKQKLDLVTILQNKKYVVAMTGDGVNDTPALKKADIGVAMGLRGTQVAQEVADMILKDDSFTSIVHAIRQGRIIFRNVRKFVIYLLSSNMSEIIIVSVAAMLNLPFQLFPLQILYINLLTDVLQALALGVTEGDRSIMKKKPRKMEDPVLKKSDIWAVVYYSLIMSVCAISAVYISHFTIHRTESWNDTLSNNVLFYTLIIAQIIHVFNMGSTNIPFFKTEVFLNKFVWVASLICIGLLIASYLIIPIREVLHVDQIPQKDWGIILGMSFLSFLLIQLSQKVKIVKQ